MPIRYWILEADNLTFARWSGDITVPEMRDNFLTYLADPLYRQGRPELLDMRDVTALDIGISDMLPLLGMVNQAELASTIRTRTVIVTSRKVIFGIARMYQLLASNQDGIDVLVFDNEADALSALGRPERDIGTFAACLPET